MRKSPLPHKFGRRRTINKKQKRAALILNAARIKTNDMPRGSYEPRGAHYPYYRFSVKPRQATVVSASRYMLTSG